uniref:Uncharacterized protein n=1 Tax=viral metagenome TaxID=1070528 RepID=A0A6C0CHP4_9ZZZZ
MAEVFEILDKVLYSRNCPLGVEDVYEKEYFEKNPAATGDEDEFEDNKPPSIHKMEEEEQLEWAYKVLKVNEANPKHGDVIWIGGDDYRNNGIHFWDAKNNKIIPMETKIADYGHVPKMFAVGKGEGEFSSRHWDGISYYNNLEPYWSSKTKQWFYPSNGEHEPDTDSE